MFGRCSGGASLKKSATKALNERSRNFSWIPISASDACNSSPTSSPKPVK